ncbi:glycosyltransferase family 2 protein [Actinotalea sp. K2]|uniref:glycosyltransferase family A protein n=1 Tax=Actinotalea sp. K2 TaxID=2939438 RepID=UPI002017CBD9|nr:glycosyltransferase family 2 protein [Actinotalea sp. K2]MCL3859730.1 glycosyltransferase family 2 protein [Actinotalea sp. K2]
MALSLVVVIPVKDDATALRRCLELLDAQTRRATEVVIVDNGSTDDSAAVARAHGARVVAEPRPGIPAAASTGYDAALTGTHGMDVIVRCDADSEPPADWLERIHTAFVDDPALQALTGQGDFTDIPRWRAATIGRLYLHSYYLTMGAALANHPLWGSNMAMRAGAWARVQHHVHREDPELHDDVDLSFCLGPTARIRYDRTLRVGVSGRSLRGGSLLRRRFVRAFRTLAVNWRDMPPWRRWETRVRDGARAPNVR